MVDIMKKEKTFQLFTVTQTLLLILGFVATDDMLTMEVEFEKKPDNITEMINNGTINQTTLTSFIKSNPSFVNNYHTDTALHILARNIPIYDQKTRQDISIILFEAVIKNTTDAINLINTPGNNNSGNTVLHELFLRRRELTKKQGKRYEIHCMDKAIAYIIYCNPSINIPNKNGETIENYLSNKNNNYTIDPRILDQTINTVYYASTINEYGKNLLEKIKNKKGISTINDLYETFKTANHWPHKLCWNKALLEFVNYNTVNETSRNNKHISKILTGIEKLVRKQSFVISEFDKNTGDNIFHKLLSIYNDSNAKCIENTIYTILSTLHKNNEIGIINQLIHQKNKNHKISTELLPDTSEESTIIMETIAKFDPQKKKQTSCPVEPKENNKQIRPNPTLLKNSKMLLEELKTSKKFRKNFIH